MTDHRGTFTEDLKASDNPLAALIAAAINSADGFIPFERFMHLALYAPGMGYYQRGVPVGEQGDFTTAPEISPLFGACLGEQCHQLLKQAHLDSILEFGAGSGKLAADLMTRLQHHDCLPRRYYILEVSASLQQKQQQSLRHHPWYDRIRWLSRLPDSFEGVVIANEVLDAMPVCLFRHDRNRLWLRGVGLRQGAFCWTEKPWSGQPRVKQHINDLMADYHWPQPYDSEIHIQALDWLRTVAGCLKKGVILLLDYGFPEHEFYHPQRHQGTLMCHHRHQAHDNPLIHVGEQDITAHLDFSALAAAGREAGLELAGYTTQAFFLLSNGLENIAVLDPDDDRKRLQTATQIKKLTLPSEMGELFKVQAFSRGIDIRLQGFEMLDFSHKL